MAEVADMTRKGWWQNETWVRGMMKEDILGRRFVESRETGAISWRHGFLALLGVAIVVLLMGIDQAEERGQVLEDGEEEDDDVVLE